MSTANIDQMCTDNPYLAVIDNSPISQSASYLENTIGGHLRLPRCLAPKFDPNSTAACRQCGRPMLNLLQLSCPLFGLASCRLMYFFLCTGADCLASPELPLRCLRAQFACESAAAAADNQTRSLSTASPSSTTAAATGAKTIDYAEWGSGDADDWGDGESANDALEVTDEPPEMEPEVEPELALAADLEETFAIESSLPLLAGPCRRLAVFDESELLPDGRDAAPEPPIDLASIRAATNSAGEAAIDDGDDEINQPLTRLEQKFYARLSRCPSQLLRYQWSGRPLLVVPLDASTVDPCANCGSARCFELQLMPALLNLLNADLANQIDVATALLFTCSASCQPAEGFVEETIVIQRELPVLVRSRCRLAEDLLKV